MLEYWELTLDSFQAHNLTCEHLIKVLTGCSRDAINWLQDKFSLNLSKVSCLGGHSQLCTHCSGAQFPGIVITYVAPIWVLNILLLVTVNKSQQGFALGAALISPYSQVQPTGQSQVQFFLVMISPYTEHPPQKCTCASGELICYISDRAIGMINVKLSCMYMVGYTFDAPSSQVSGYHEEVMEWVNDLDILKPKELCPD